MHLPLKTPDKTTHLLNHKNMTSQLPTTTQALVSVLLGVSVIYVVHYYHNLVQSQARQIHRLEAERIIKDEKVEDDDDIIMRQLRNFRALEAKYAEEQAKNKAAERRCAELEETCTRLRLELEEKIRNVDSNVFLKSNVLEEDVDLKKLTWNGERYLLVLTKELVDIWKKDHVKNYYARGTSWTCTRFGYSR